MWLKWCLLFNALNIRYYIKDEQKFRHALIRVLFPNRKTMKHVRHSRNGRTQKREAHVLADVAQDQFVSGQTAQLHIHDTAP